MRSFVLTAFAFLGLAASAGAQVGHDPQASPYRTLRYGQFIGATVGYFNGSGGQVQVAPHEGTTVGLRYDFLGNGTITVGLGVSYGSMNRMLADPNQPIENALSGPVKQSVTITEAILQFNITGGKTWHRLAPFLSGGFGLVLAGATPEDETEFKFRTKLHITPGIGTRVFLSDRMFVKLEARNTFWQASYPAAYRSIPSEDPTKPPIVTRGPKEWIANGWYSVGVHYAFHRPF